MGSIDQTFAIIVRTCCGISLVSIIFTLCVCFRFRSTLPVFYSFVVVIQLVESLKLFFTVIPDTGSICEVAGFFITYGSLSAVAWSTILCQKFYMRHVYEEEIKKNMKIYAFIAVLVPFVLAGLPLATKSYQNIDGICWISGRFEIVWKFSSFYSFIMFAIGFTFWRYNQLINEIKLDMQDLPNSSVVLEDKRSSFLRMRLYSMILLICFGPSIIYLVMETAGVRSKDIELICICFECLFGLMNTLVYICKQDIMELIADSLICKKKGRNRSISNYLVMDDEGRDQTAMQDFSVI